ncbi:MAG TPA: hypothetical protein VMW79_07795 [Anaerolineae bacterium]|nr:hypothetical protein [Anaerolineae bacterium]
MAIQERTCKRCSHHWEVWRQFIRDLPIRPACPECGSRATKVEIIGSAPVHFKGYGWTPKPGTVNDLRDIRGMEDPKLAEAMDD